MEILNKKFKLKKGIYKSSIDDVFAKKVGFFYEEDPFPNYSVNDDKLSILKIGNNNQFTKNLKNEIGYNQIICEVGCGTAQLSNYLAINTNNQIFALDISENSLNTGLNFSKKNEILNINYVCCDIFEKPFNKKVFDHIISLGVLHHTKNPRESFDILCENLKNNGYIILGLYNSIGRIRTYFRAFIYKYFNKRIAEFLDPVLRKITKNNPKKYNAWVKDQYLHPSETGHTIDEILDWFENIYADL